MWGALSVLEASRLEQEEMFLIDAQRRISSIESHLRDHKNLATSVAGLFQASKFVSETGFMTFIERSNLTKVGLHVAVIIDEVKHEDVPSYVEYMRDEQTVEWSDFAILELLMPESVNADGTMTTQDDRLGPHRVRELYHPLTYYWGNSEREAPRGFNGSAAGRLSELIALLNDNDGDAISPIVETNVFTSEPATGIATISRLYVRGDAMPVGRYLLTFIDLKELVQTALRDFSQGNMRVFLKGYEMPGLTEDERIASGFHSGLLWDGAIPGDPFLSLQRMISVPKLYVSSEIKLTNQQMEIVVMPPIEGLAVKLLPAGLVASMGLVITLLLTLSTHRIIRSRDLIEEEVDQKTRELTAANNSLETQHHSLLHLNRELSEAVRDADKANRSKSQFVATMSHELRTPLNAIIGFSSILEEQFSSENSNKVQAERIGLVRKSGEDLLALINDILDFSKIEARELRVSPGPIDLTKFLEDLQETMSPFINKGTTFIIQVEDGMMDIHSDEGRLRQILSNLLVNSGKFTSDGEITLTLNASGETFPKSLVIKVADTGIGIAADQQARIFEAFHQIEDVYTRKSGGTGLGLSICKELVNLLGGTISVESESDKGSVFTVELPDAVPGGRPNDEATPSSIEPDPRVNRLRL